MTVHTDEASLTHPPLTSCYAACFLPGHGPGTPVLSCAEDLAKLGLALMLASGSVHFSCSVVSDSSLSHGPQHIRLPCTSPTPGVYANSSPWSLSDQPTVSSSVVPFSSCLQSFPASGCFPMNWFFELGGQSIGASVSASVLPVNIQD